MGSWASVKISELDRETLIHIGKKRKTREKKMKVVVLVWQDGHSEGPEIRWLNNIYFLAVVEARSPGSKFWKVWLLLRPHSLAFFQCPDLFFFFFSSVNPPWYVVLFLKGHLSDWIKAHHHSLLILITSKVPCLQL